MWFVYALLGAIGKSYSGFFKKKIAKSVTAAMYLWLAYSIILLVLTPFMVFKASSIVNAFFALPLIVIGAALSSIIATQLNLEALKREELSYVAPLNAFVPLFTLLIANAFLNETPPRFGILGVVTMVVGAYIVSIKPEQINWYDPFKRLISSAGAQLSIAVALFYAINTVLIKVISNDGYDSLTIFYLTTLIGWLFLIHIPLLKWNSMMAMEKSDKFAVLGGGISSFASGYFHILATASTFTSYAVSVRRLDAVFSVLLGWRYLKETNIKVKLAGSIIMMVGTIMLAVS
jgi:drug/metabolite transporter (DMT)-like permease